MRILNLQAENVKRIVAIDITPEGDVVEIAGGNGEGKSSVLDAIWWTLGGAGTVQQKPVRAGETRASTRIDLGEIIVTREFKAVPDGNDFTTSLRVENAEGAKYDKPQAMLDAMLGSLSFDPLEFMRMDDKSQFVALRQYAPEIDFEGHEKAQAADYDARTDKNRRSKELRARAGGFVVAPETPDEKVDEDLLTQELANVGKQAGERARLESMQAQQDAQLDDIGRQIRSIDEQISKLTADRAILADRETKGIAIISARPPLPEIPDVESIQRKLVDARRINANVDYKRQRKELIAEADRAETESASLTNSMQNRERDLNAAMSAAKFPIDGLQLSPQRFVVYNGIPFRQASDAEQLRVSTAFAMAGAKKIRIARIRDGSLLDEKSMAIIAEMAKKNDVQVWIERVDTSGKVGVVIEAGKVKSTPKSRSK